MSKEDAPNIRKSKCCYRCVYRDDGGLGIWCVKFRFFAEIDEYCDCYKER